MLGRLFVIVGAVLAVTANPAAAFSLDGPPKIAWIYLNAKNDTRIALVGVSFISSQISNVKHGFCP